MHASGFTPSARGHWRLLSGAVTILVVGIAAVWIYLPREPEIVRVDAAATQPVKVLDLTTASKIEAAVDAIIADESVSDAKLEKVARNIANARIYLQYNDVKAFNNARETLRARGRGVAILHAILSDRRVRAEAEQQLSKVEEEVAGLVAGNPNGCVLVGVFVYQSRYAQGLGLTPNRRVGEVFIMGTGETPIDAHAEYIFARPSGSVASHLGQDYFLDTERTKAVCFGMVDGQLRGIDISYAEMAEGYAEAAALAKQKREAVQQRIQSTLEQRDADRLAKQRAAEQSERQAADEQARVKAKREAQQAKFQRQQAANFRNLIRQMESLAVSEIKRIERKKALEARRDVTVGGGGGSGIGGAGGGGGGGRDIGVLDFTDEPLIIRAGE